MSTWHVRAIERLGTPLPSWPTIWGPADPGADPIAANALRMVDLTPFLSPLQDFSSMLERDLTKASFGSLPLDLADADESKALLLGPSSTTLATADRYFGPWIQVTEVWTGGSAVRFTGYLDETSLQWDEAAATTKATVLHASQLLKERKLSDLAELLRPWPSYPLSGTTSFTASTADAILQAAVPSFTPRSDAVAREAALWAGGQISWMAGVASEVDKIWWDPVDTSRVRVHTTTYPPPTAPSLSLVIGTATYLVDHIEWDTTISADVLLSDSMEYIETWTDKYRVARIYLQGYPDLTGILTSGATCTFGLTEATRTHYALAEDVPAPASGSDGQRWLRLNSVEQLVAGDQLNITFWDTAQSVQRRTKLDVTVIDTDGETGKVWLKEPLAQALTTATVLKIRRNSRDPVLFDGVAYAAAVVAPFGLDTTYLRPAATSRPVLAWMPHDVAAPQLYGIHNLQGLAGGSMRISRRGPLRASDNTYPLAGCWEGSWAAGWSWIGSAAASTPIEVLGDIHQWPEGANAFWPPVLYIEGDLSAGALIPVNGWRPAWRTWKTPVGMVQDPEAWWNGTAIQWSSTTASAIIPAKVVAFLAQSASPGRYTRQSTPTWSFAPHTGDGTLGPAVTPAITGALPTGNCLALGMGIYAPAAADEQEALLGLITTDTAQPFTNMSAALLSQAAGGDLTLRQSLSLWSTGSTPVGNWALGGGLVVQTWNETLDGSPYPHTRLHKLDGTRHLTADFLTLEIIPQSIQPLALTGAAGARTIGGWYALALETYLTDSFAPARRLRFLWLGPSLTLLNGDPEPNPGDPLNPAAAFRRGDLVATYIPDGAVPCRLVRAGQGGTCMGFFGGRLFQVASEIPRTIERLEIADLSAADYLEKLSQALLASAIPDESGNIRLVSRGSGALRVQDLGGGNRVSVKTTQRSARKTIQTYRGYISEVRVSYKDAVTGDSREMVVPAIHAGGKPLALDMGSLVGGETGARAIGEAVAHWFGAPAGVISETWAEERGGVAVDQAPPFWFGWQVGDLITFTTYASGSTTPIEAHKIHQFKPRPEDREVAVEFLKLPVLINPAAP